MCCMRVIGSPTRKITLNNSLTAMEIIASSSPTHCHEKGTSVNVSPSEGLVMAQ